MGKNKRKKEQETHWDLMLYGIFYPFMMLANMETKHKLLGDNKYARAQAHTYHILFYYTHAHNRKCRFYVECVYVVYSFSKKFRE